MRRIKLVDILLVEDNIGDVRLTQEALKGSKIINKIHVAKDGMEASDFLFKRKDYKNNEIIPGLIILDLNLPKKSGLELLSEIKGDEYLKKIPVVVLTSSEAEEDVLKSYKLHASCYINKPMDFEKYEKIVSSIENFWLSVVTLPI